MKTFKRVLLIVLAVTLTAAVVLGIWGLVIPAAKVNKLEGLSMADSATAEYVKYLPDADTIYSYAQDLFDMGMRLPGTEAGKKAQTYVKDKFTEFGLSDVDIIPSKSKLYTCDSYSLTVNGADMDSCYINYSGVDGSFGAFNADAEGKMVYVGSDTDSTVDVKGKIVVADVEFQAIPYTACNYIGYLKYDPILVTEGLLNAGFAKTYDNDTMILGGSTDVDVLPDLPWHGFETAQYDADVFSGGKVVELKFELFPTSWTFKAGHSIRLSIACADSPTFETNSALTEDTVVTVYKTEEYSSKIVLPVIPKE